MRLERIRQFRASAAISALAALCAASAVFAARLEREEKRTIDPQGRTVLVVENARGKSVVIGTNGDRIRVLATKRVKARDDARAQRLMDELDWVVTEGDRTVTIETQHARSHAETRTLWSVFKSGRESALIDYAIEVPRSFSVNAATTSGEVRISNCTGGFRATATSGSIYLGTVSGGGVVELTSGSVEANGVDGDLEIVASSGRIDVQRVDGRLDVRATSGDVEVTRIGGDTDIRLSSGDLRLNNCLGNLTFKTSTGDAAIAGVEGSISAVTSSGDLEVMILPVGERDFRLSSSSGNIGVTYPKLDDLGFRLDVSTSSGSIEGNMPIQLKEVTRRRLRGIVGTGKSRVVIETSSGDVRVAERKNGKSKRE